MAACPNGRCICRSSLPGSRCSRSHRFEFELTFPALPLQPGKYWIRAHAADPEGLRVFDNVERPLVVRGRTRELGLVHLAHRWHDGVDR